VLAARRRRHAIEVRRDSAANAVHVDEKARRDSQLRRRVTKISALILLPVIAAIAIAGVVFDWRLSLGPVSLNFMTGTIQSQINKNLTGMTVAVDGGDRTGGGSGIPQVRLRNIILRTPRARPWRVHRRRHRHR
jgi:hypothetical protein